MVPPSLGNPKHSSLNPTYPPKSPLNVPLSPIDPKPLYSSFDRFQKGGGGGGGGGKANSGPEVQVFVAQKSCGLHGFRV